MQNLTGVDKKEESYDPQAKIIEQIKNKASPLEMQSGSTDLEKIGFRIEKFDSEKNCYLKFTRFDAETGKSDHRKNFFIKKFFRRFFV